jgi:predicted metal-dependent hydrolase
MSWRTLKGQHDKAFYQLCCRMEPDYHQPEFDVRAWLCWLEVGGENLWGSGAREDGPGA